MRRATVNSVVPRLGASRGFTLVELVVTLTVSVVVVAFSAMLVSAPVAGFTDQARRMRLVDSADTALRRMSRDVRRALPNSIRTTTSSGIVALEMLSTVDGGRYREQGPGTPAQILDLTTADTSFNVIGPFTQIAKPFSSTSHHLAIYNVGVPGADAYELSNVITPAGTQIDITTDTGGEDRIAIAPAFRFAYGSPTRRVYLVDGPITYLCDPIAGTMTRYSGYVVTQDQADRDSAAELLAAGASSPSNTKVSSCP